MYQNNNGEDMKKILKYKFVIIGIITVILLSIYIVNYRNTYNYKLKKLGYSDSEINEIKKLNDDSIEYISSINYDKDILKLINEKYFIEKNLKRYIDYKSKNNVNNSDVIAIVNVKADKGFYNDTKDTDIKKGYLMLTNKFYKLNSSYDSSNMVLVSNQHSYGENQMLTREAYSAFISMFKSAKEENLTLIINSSFRSYEDQDKIYKYYLTTLGEEEANKRAAKAGFSEHQTGLSVDIQTYGSTGDTFEEFDEFKWLSDNAYKYGFILRYPKGKEYITGYEYESWHYRYVGVEVSTYIHDNDITFDEYYAYFIENN